MNQPIFLLPGAIQNQGEAQPTLINVLAYRPQKHVSETLRSADGLESLMNRWPVLWIDVQGLADIEALQQIARLMNVHDLWLADLFEKQINAQFVGNTGFVNVALPSPEVQRTMLGLCLTPSVVVTLHDGPLPMLNDVKTAIRDGLADLRAKGANYLAYTILDAYLQIVAAEVTHASQSAIDIQHRLVGRDVTPQLEEIRELYNRVYALRELKQGLSDVVFAVQRWPMFQTEAMRPLVEHLNSRLVHFGRTLDQFATHQSQDVWAMYRIRTTTAILTSVRFILYLVVLGLFLILVAIIWT